MYVFKLFIYMITAFWGFDFFFNVFENDAIVFLHIHKCKNADIK